MGRVARMIQVKIGMVARDGPNEIAPPTGRPFSGPRSTTELPGLSRDVQFKNSSAPEGPRANELGMVARDGIEPPTPAFSGPRSTTELPGLSLDKS